MSMKSDLKNKAREAFRRKNYSLAVEIYLEALQFNADDAETVEGFFQAAKKARETKGKALFGGMLSKMSVGSSRDPAKKMNACFRGLAKDPENKGLLLGLGEAAGLAGADESAVAAYKRATDADPNDAEAWKRLGEFLGRKGRIPEALKALDHAVRLRPRDQETVKLRKNLAAEGALKHAGYETAKSSRDLIKDKDAATRLEQQVRMQLTPEHAQSEVESVRRRITEKPEDARLHVQLADLLLQTGDEPGALHALEQAVSLEPSNYDLSIRLGDLRLRSLQRGARDARDAHEASPDDEALATAREAAMQAFLQAQRDEYRRRVDEHPMDLIERFRLGRTLLALGQTDEAAAEFQQTLRDPSQKTNSLLLLAQCFEKKNLGNLAVKKLEEALADFPSLSSPKSKDVHYAYADLLERTGNREKAREIFEQIFEVDITYRDVSQRLDALANSA